MREMLLNVAMKLGMVLFNPKQTYRLKQMKTKDAAAFKGNAMSCTIFSGLFCVILACAIVAVTFTIPVQAAGLFDAGYTAGKPSMQGKFGRKYADFYDICEINQLSTSVPRNTHELDMGTKDVYGYTPYAELTQEGRDKRDATGDNGPWHVIGTEPIPLDAWAREGMQIFTASTPCKMECRADGEQDIETNAPAWEPEDQGTVSEKSARYVGGPIGRTIEKVWVDENDHSQGRDHSKTTIKNGMFKDFGKVEYGDEEEKLKGLGGPAALPLGHKKWCEFKIDAGGSCANSRSMWGAGVGKKYIKLNYTKMPHCRGIIQVYYVTKTSFSTVFIGVNALFPLFTLVTGTIFFYAFLWYSGHWAEEGGLEHRVDELYVKVFADEIAQTQANPTAAGKAAGQTQASPTKAQLEMVETEDSTDARV